MLTAPVFLVVEASGLLPECFLKTTFFPPFPSPNFALEASDQLSFPVRSASPPRSEPFRCVFTLVLVAPLAPSPTLPLPRVPPSPTRATPRIPSPRPLGFYSPSSSALAAPPQPWGREGFPGTPGERRSHVPHTQSPGPAVPRGPPALRGRLPNVLVLAMSGRFPGARG